MSIDFKIFYFFCETIEYIKKPQAGKVIDMVSIIYIT